MNEKRQIAIYVLIDWLTAAVAWFVFWFYRKTTEFYLFNGDESSIDYRAVFDNMLDDKLVMSMILVPLSWLFAYFLVGSYHKSVYRSRLSELWQTFVVVLLGSIALFFIAFLDDYVGNYKSYYTHLVVYFALQFGFTYLSRLLITTSTLRKIQKRKLGIRTLIIGSNDNAVRIYKQMSEWNRYYIGNKFVGFVNVFEQDNYQLSQFLPHLGNYRDLKRVVEEQDVENVIIAFDRSESKVIAEISNVLDQTMVDVSIVPDVQDMAFGVMRQTNIWKEPLLSLTPEPMPYWQQSVKRLFDIIFSVFAIVLLSPVYIFTAIMVKASSSGPIFYRQERIGKKGKPFKMLKFRSMYIDAETLGPQLSSDNDSRITPWGRFMRKVRLDEIPQFFNVLRGDMSIVGYRPERKFYIDQIAEKAPHYYKLLRIKPGITSWGEVKYGYAENVEQMVERLKYDILYIQNMNILIDIKIMIYTVLIIVQGRGK